MSAIEAVIEIAAAPSDVWAVLTAFDRYKDWNPFIPKIDGEAKAGGTVTVHIGIGAAAAPIKAEIVTFRPDQELVWRSHLITQGLFDRDHIFRIEPTETGCRVSQTQTYAGPMAAVAGLLTNEMVRHGLKSMNDALKRRAEQAAARA